MKWWNYTTCTSENEQNSFLSHLVNFPVMELYLREGNVFTLSVILFTGWVVYVEGAVCPRGSPSRGSLSRGLCPGGLCPGWSLSKVGVSVQEGFLSRVTLSRGVSVQGVSVQGVSVQGSPSERVSIEGGGLCPKGGPYHRDSTSVVEEWAVCILLECILVQNRLTQFLHDHHHQGK